MRSRNGMTPALELSAVAWLLFHWLHDIINEREETLVNLLEYSCVSSVVN